METIFAQRQPKPQPLNSRRIIRLIEGMRHNQLRAARSHRLRCSSDTALMDYRCGIRKDLRVGSISYHPMLVRAGDSRTSFARQQQRTPSQLLDGSLALRIEASRVHHRSRTESKNNRRFSVLQKMSYLICKSGCRILTIVKSESNGLRVIRPVDLWLCKRGREHRQVEVRRALIFKQRMATRGQAQLFAQIIDRLSPALCLFTSERFHRPVHRYACSTEESEQR